MTALEEEKSEKRVVSVPWVPCRGGVATGKGIRRA